MHSTEILFTLAYLALAPAEITGGTGTQIEIQFVTNDDLVAPQRYPTDLNNSETLPFLQSSSIQHEANRDRKGLQFRRSLRSSERTFDAKAKG